jgi:predicted unusual protein kinase regulating ubiquinone biosynthesis (AarF/ABC1/UbiB family)
MDSNDAKNNNLSSIKSSVFSRNFSLFKLSLSSGIKGATYMLGQFAQLSEQPSHEARMKWLTSQADMLVKELGQLKGSIMKVGQMLSVYGEHFLPPEVNQILKKLQNQSPPLNWSEIDKCVKAQLTPEQLAKVKINPQALACASLGQVHLAEYQNQKIALKVQYPKVDQAIDSDLKTMRFIFGALKILPQQEQALDALFNEVRTMLHQEVDYTQELNFTQDYAKMVAGDSRFIVPKVYPEISTQKVLATSFEEGVALDSLEVQRLSQERRDKLAMSFLDLYLRELLQFGTVQTDPHFGNYKVRLDPNGENDQWVLLDFGAVRNFPKTFMRSYAKLVRGSILENPELLLQGAAEIGFVKASDPEELKQIFVEFCYLMVEPFQLKDGKSQVYDWGTSDIPGRTVRKATALIKTFHARIPPREIVFLDRKSAGTFTVLAKLRAQLDAHELLMKYLAIAES